LLDPALYTELRRVAIDEQRTLTDVVERTLRAGLAAARRRPPRRSIPSYDLGPYLVPPARRRDDAERG